MANLRLITRTSAALLNNARSSLLRRSLATDAAKPALVEVSHNDKNGMIIIFFYIMISAHLWI